MTRWHDKLYRNVFQKPSKSGHSESFQKTFCWKILWFKLSQDNLDFCLRSQIRADHHHQPTTFWLWFTFLSKGIICRHWIRTVWSFYHGGHSNTTCTTEGTRSQKPSVFRTPSHYVTTFIKVDVAKNGFLPSSLVATRFLNGLIRLPIR